MRLGIGRGDARGDQAAERFFRLHGTALEEVEHFGDDVFRGHGRRDYSWAEGGVTGATFSSGKAIHRIT